MCMLGKQTESICFIMISMFFHYYTDQDTIYSMSNLIEVTERSYYLCHILFIEAIQKDTIHGTSNPKKQQKKDTTMHTWCYQSDRLRKHSWHIGS